MSKTTETPNTSEASTASGSQTVSRAMEILRLVACGQEIGVRLTDLVQMTGLSRPTVHRILKTLSIEGAVEQDELSRRYRIGPEMILLGIARTRRFPLLHIAGNGLEHIAQTVGDTAFISVRHGLDSICIGRNTGHHPIQVLSINVGARRPLGVGVSGVALLSCLESAEAERITKTNERRLAFHNLTPDTLMQRVEQARTSGYAYTSSGVMPGTRAMAIPVLRDDGQPLAALTVTTMAERLDDERLPHVLQIMQEQARAIAQQHSSWKASGFER